MALAASDPLVLATDAAEALVRDGVPFREAHERVAASVRDGSFAPSGLRRRVSRRGAPPARVACARRSPRRVGSWSRTTTRPRSPRASSRRIDRRVTRRLGGVEGLTPLDAGGIHETHRPRRLSAARRSRARRRRPPGGSPRRRRAPQRGDSITVSGNGSVVAVPTIAVVSLGVDSRAATRQGGARCQRPGDAAGDRRRQGGGRPSGGDAVRLAVAGARPERRADRVCSLERRLATVRRRSGRRGDRRCSRTLARTR